MRLGACLPAFWAVIASRWIASANLSERATYGGTKVSVGDKLLSAQDLGVLRTYLVASGQVMMTTPPSLIEDPPCGLPSVSSILQAPSTVYQSGTQSSNSVGLRWWSPLNTTRFSESGIWKGIRSAMAQHSGQSPDSLHLGQSLVWLQRSGDDARPIRMVCGGSTAAAFANQSMGSCQGAASSPCADDNVMNGCEANRVGWLGVVFLASNWGDDGYGELYVMDPLTPPPLPSAHVHASGRIEQSGFNPAGSGPMTCTAKRLWQECSTPAEQSTEIGTMISPVPGRVVILPASSTYMVRPPSPTTRQLQMVLQVWGTTNEPLANAGRQAQTSALELRQGIREAAWAALDSFDQGSKSNTDLENYADMYTAKAMDTDAESGCINEEQHDGHVINQQISQAASLSSNQAATLSSNQAASLPSNQAASLASNQAASLASNQAASLSSIYTQDRAISRLSRNISAADGSGRNILVFDGLLTAEDAALAVRAVLAGPRGGVSFEDTEEGGNDNVVWIAGLDADRFTKTRLWEAVRSILVLASGGRDTWFPYDVSCNHLELVDEPRRHLDCQGWEDEFTVVMYLNHEWRRDAAVLPWSRNDHHSPSNRADKGPWPFHGGETVFYRGPTLSSEALTAVRPAFGRVVVFPGTLWHAGRPPMAVHGGRRFSFVVKASNSERYARRKMLRESMDVVTKNIMPMLRHLRVDEASKQDEIGVAAWNKRVDSVVIKAAERLRGLVLEVADSIKPFGDMSATEEDDEEYEDDEDAEDDAYGSEDAGFYGEDAQSDANDSADDDKDEARDVDSSAQAEDDEDSVDQLSEDTQDSVLWDMSDAEKQAVRDQYESSQYGMFNGYGRSPGEHQQWMSRVMHVAGDSLADLMDTADT